MKGRDIMSNADALIWTGLRVSLSIAENAVIREDMKTFRNNNSKRNNDFRFGDSVFLHRVFLSILSEKYETPPKWEDIQKEEKNAPQSNGERKRNNTKGIKISVNQGITEILEKVIPDEQKDAASKSFGELSAAYFTYMIKKYIHLTQEERERVFYRKIFNDLNDCISLKEIIKIRRIISKGAFNRGQDGEDEITDTDSVVTMLPYKIVYSKDSGHFYIAGFKLMQGDDGLFDCLGLYSIPIYKILPYNPDRNFYRVKRAAVNSRSSIIRDYDALIQKMENRLNSDGILYISDPINNVKVRLTEKGIEMMLGRDKYRPYNIEPDVYDKHIISFDATRFQTFQFFFKFGADAEVLEPEEYREFFRGEYFKALNVYPATTGSTHHTENT